MLLWVVFAVMSAGVVVMLLHPLLARRDDAAASAGAATAVYRDQLAEVEAEAKRGLIGAEEAESARREIARRIIASVPTELDRPLEPTRTGSESETARHLRTRIAAVTGLLLPLMALAVYLQTGSPGIPSQSIEARRAAPAVDSEMAKLISAVETRLKEHPDDGRGWDVIAPVYLRLGRYAEAAQAYAHAARLLGENAHRLAGFAEAAMLRDNGRVGDEARNALTQLLKIEPGHVQARFWLAFAKEQDGKFAEAVADYEKLMTEAPSGAEWRPALEQRIAAVRTALGRAGAPGPTASAATGAGEPGKGPTAADIAAAERLSPDDRQAMIDGMVSGLAARLEKDGRDLEGWRKLIRALTVLGRKDEAVAALGRARKSLAGEPKALAALSDLAKSLGLGT
jgi:cytochrome c-type biogenesis protein CcmH